MDNADREALRMNRYGNKSPSVYIQIYTVPCQYDSFLCKAVNKRILTRLQLSQFNSATGDIRATLNGKKKIADDDNVL